MGTLDAPLKAAVQSVVGAIGKTTGVSLRKETAGGLFNPTTDLVESSVPTVRSVNAVVTEFEEHELGGDIKRGDVKLLIPASGLTTPPDMEESCIIDTVPHEIVRIKPVYGSSEVIMYELAVHRT